MKKPLFSWPLALPLACCLTSCASTNSGGDATAAQNIALTTNVADSNTASNVANATPNTTPDKTSDAAGKAASPKASPSASPTANKPSGSKQKTYRVADEAQPNYPAVLVQALHKIAVPPPPASLKVPDKARVRFSTSKGDITIELNGKAAPLHVKSFLYLARKGFYNGTTFHRFADLSGGTGQPARIIQGGDPLSKSAQFRALAGAGGPGYRIPREYNSLKHNAMVLAMARTADPDSAGSQFYLTLDPTPFLDREKAADGFGYTVFGKVLKGQNVVLRLQQDDVLKSVTVLQ